MTPPKPTLDELKAVIRAFHAGDQTHTLDAFDDMAERAMASWDASQAWRRELAVYRAGIRAGRLT